MRISNTITFIFIVIVGCILRFYNYFEIPYTHDEFSALFRTDFNSFSDLIEYGVKIPDTHPAGVQVFLYYWVHLFSDAEWSVKLLFTLAGILSIFFLYKIAKLWFNETVGLLSSAFFATAQFTVIYSQIARPYVSGLFFSLAMVFFWSKLILLPEKRGVFNSILFVLSAALCAYNHHFSLLFSFLVGVCGLFMIQRKFLVRYILSGIAIFLLYVPHLGIFFFQLKKGGVESWLSKPKPEFILNYLGYIFQFSHLNIALVFLLIVIGIASNLKGVFFSYKKQFLFLLLFITPFLIGYFYSVYFNAVLQYSVLIFSFPFLYFIIFSFFKNLKPKWNALLVVAIATINVFALIYQRRHYELFYKSPFEQVLIQYKNAQNEYENVLSFVDGRTDILNYYISKDSIPRNFIHLSQFSDKMEFIDFLERESAAKDYLYLGTLPQTDPRIFAMARHYFPTLEEWHCYVGGTTYLLSKSDLTGESGKSFTQNFDGGKERGWSSIDSLSLQKSGAENHYFPMGRATEYSPGFTVPLSELSLEKYDFIDVELNVFPKEKIEEVALILSLEKEGEIIFWSSTSFAEYLDEFSIEKWGRIYHSAEIPTPRDSQENIHLKIYVWNLGKKEFYIDDFKIKTRKGNPVIYGLIQPVPFKSFMEF